MWHTDRHTDRQTHMTELISTQLLKHKLQHRNLNNTIKLPHKIKPNTKLAFLLASYNIQPGNALGLFYSSEGPVLLGPGNNKLLCRPALLGKI